MLDTQRKDLLFSLSDTVTGKDDRGEEWERYLLDPSLLLEETAVQPLILFTSGKELIRGDTEKLRVSCRKRTFRTFFIRETICIPHAKAEGSWRMRLI